jgi:hypothetical protein
MPTIERVTRHGRAELLIDQQVASRVWARPDLPGYQAIEKAEQYVEADIDIYFVSMHQPTLLFWDGDQYYDSRILEAYLRWIADYYPNAKLIVYLGIRTNSPAKWNRRHEDQLTLLSNGEKLDAPSVASERWKQDAGVALTKVIEHLDATDLADRVIGYNFVTGANEWFAYSAYHRDPYREGFADYSAPMHERFRRFVRDRYAGDTQALREAWQDADIDFDAVAVPTVDQRQSFGHEGMFFARQTMGRRLVDFYECWHDAWADLAEFYCKLAKDVSNRQVLCGLMNGYSYCGAHAGLPQISNYGGAQRLMDSPHVDFLQSPYHYYNRSFPGVHYSQHATDSVLMRGKLLIDQIDTKTHLKTIDGGTKSNSRTPYETEQVLKRDAALSIAKNTHCYWMEISHGIFRGFMSPMHYERLHYDDPAIATLIKQLKSVSDRLPELKPDPVAEVAWFASKRSAYHMRADHFFEQFFLDAQRQWEMPYLGTPYDDYIFEDFDRVETDYKLYLFPNANRMTDAVRRRVRAKVEAGATAVFWYGPGYVGDAGCALDHCADATGMTLGRLDRRHWLHVELDHARDAPLLRGVEARDYGTDIEPDVLNRTQEWLMFPGDRIDDYRFNPVFYCDDPDAEVLGTVRGLDVAGLAYKRVGKGHVVYTSAPRLPASILRNVLDLAGVHRYSPDGDLVYANSRTLTLCAQQAGPREVVLPGPRRVTDAFTGADVALGDRFTVESTHGQTHLFQLDPVDA